MVATTDEDGGNCNPFYPDQYAQFTSETAIKIRREVYGEDQGQQGWRSVDEQAEIATLVGEVSPGHVLDIACGSGGPSLALAERTGCWLTGIDIEPAGVWQAERAATAKGLTDRVGFATLDCDRALPFADESFDVVVCIDALLHLKDRFAALADWARLLRQGGRLIFADAAVLTGVIAIDDLNIRASQGPFFLAPPGLNENSVEAAGLVLQRVENRTQAVADFASRWHSARIRYADELLKQESAEWFAKRQRFLAMTAELAVSGRLSRFFYVAEKRSAP